VNPKGGDILGYKVYESMEKVPEDVDLAVITLPAELTVKIFESVARKSRFVIPIAGGFGETGEKGKKMEDEIRNIARKYGTRIIGPNTVGIYIPSTGVNTALVVRERSDQPSSYLFLEPRSLCNRWLQHPHLLQRLQLQFYLP